MHRLVTFLGTGNYQPVCYRFGERTARETCWIARALQDLLQPQPTETVVLATDAAWEKNGEGLCDSFREAGLAGPQRVAIPEGRNEEELWKQFDIIKKQVRVDCSATVTVDITHAFRHQPFFTSGILTFVRSIDEPPPEVRVVYGAFEMKEQDQNGTTVSPVLELTPFVELLDWTHDLVLFLKSGRLGRLPERTVAIGRAMRSAWFRSGRASPEPRVKQFAEALERFARDLQTVRTGSLLLGTDGERSSVRRLLDETAAVRSQLADVIPPLADVLDRVEKMARELQFDGPALTGTCARDVLARLAWRYFLMGRYIEAATTVRESFVTLQGPAAAAMPGRKGYDHESRLKTDEEMRCRLGDRFRELADLRNDLDHAGYNRNPKPANTIVEMTRRWIDELSRAACKPSVFVNISNHPCADWPEEQRRAALDLAGHIEDVPFPEVGPDWSLCCIEKEAEEIEKRLPPETTHAMVQGEFTLTAALVRRLQQRGIRCLAATTERRVERTQDGGEVRSFRFVRFREYPRLT